jgi:PPIC-type PPIASE domain
MALEEQALREHLDQDPGFQRQIELTRMQGLAKAEAQKLYGEITVSSDEISKYYAAHPEEFETLEVRRIVVRSKPGTSPPAAGAGTDDRKARLEAIRKEIVAGKDPAEIAKEFKDASEGFIDLKTQPVRLAQFGPDWRDTISKMKDGEVSDPRSAPEGLVALQVVKRSKMDLKEATTEIDRTLKQQRLQAAIDDLKKKAGVWMDDTYFATPAPASPSAPVPAPAAPPKQ